MSSPVLRGLRGASTCAINTAEEISDVTQELLLEMLKRGEATVEQRDAFGPITVTGRG